MNFGRGFASFFFITLSFVTLTFSVMDDYTVNFTLTPETAQEGETMEAVCEVLSQGKKSYFIIWVKEAVPDKHLVEIATNQHVNSDFMSTGRYNGSYVLENNTYSHVKFVLKITDLKSEDSGKLTCKLGSTEPRDFKQFTVQVPVKEVWWTSHKKTVYTYSEDQTIFVKEGENQEFVCHVSGSYPEAMVQVFLGDKDITHNFNITHSLETAGSVKGLQPLFYKTQAVSKTAIFGYHNMSETLKCSARTSDSDPPKQASLSVNMTEYSPKFLCENKMQAKLHDQYFNLTCKVHAKPEVKDLKFQWTDDDDNETLKVGDQNTEFSATTTESDDKEEVLMVLTINRVSSKHFQRQYIFEAENDVKRETHVMRLELVSDPEFNRILTGNSLSSLMKISTTLLMLLLCVFVFM